VQLYCYFVSQSSKFCRHNPLCCFSTSNTKGKSTFRYRFSPETFGYILAYVEETFFHRCYCLRKQSAPCHLSKENKQFKMRLRQRKKFHCMRIKHSSKCNVGPISRHRELAYLWGQYLAKCYKHGHASLSVVQYDFIKNVSYASASLTLCLFVMGPSYLRLLDTRWNRTCFNYEMLYALAFLSILFIHAINYWIRNLVKRIFCKFSKFPELIFIKFFLKRVF
jgi:hypothetical protein